LNLDSQTKKYTLVICEKPNVANKIATALGTSDIKRIKIHDNIVFDVFSNNNLHYIILSSKGHLYGLSNANKLGKIFPIFDLYWSPISKPFSKNTKKLIDLISKFSKNANNYIHACDYDQEGELIGYNILELICNKAYSRSQRAKLSTLAPDDIFKSFEQLEKINKNMAYAGMFRHLLDYIYGINFSMAISSIIKVNNRSSYLTVGRVQTPTLKFVVDRDLQINYFIPLPFWNIKGHFKKDKKDNINLICSFEKNPIDTIKEANLIINGCNDKNGVVNNITSYTENLQPLFPFNLGDLQKESFRLFKYSPSYTLSIAENLYLKALISYPRTNSQILPPSINYRKILNRLGKISKIYEDYSNILLKRDKLFPNNGIKNDPAHPAIYPTGLKPLNLNSSESKIFDLIVKRFFVTFGDSAIFNKILIRILVAHTFSFYLEEKNIISKGWIEFYNPFYYLKKNHIDYSNIKLGDKLINVGVLLESKYTEPPNFYNYSSLLSKMEKEEIGTKSTRGNIIEILIKRNYVTKSIKEKSLRSSELGTFLIDFMEKYLPNIISPELTRTLERYLADIEMGFKDRIDILNNIISNLIESMDNIQKLDNIPKIDNQWTQRKDPMIIGVCPICKNGKFQIIR